MKVYLAAITGHVPLEIIKCLAAFLDFCYIVRHNAITADDLVKLQSILDRFHIHREVFVGTAAVTASRAHVELGMMDGTMASYMAMILRGEQPQPHTQAVDREDDDDDNGPELGPKSLSSIELARSPSMVSMFY
ncbi:hypothetical protein BJV78DRAFT_1159123 [Lactifluus subvellereus]|nr:hypothetical protein BJV78DRAFT_1159123 [Lactifluus subvellereus]